MHSECKYRVIAVTFNLNCGLHAVSVGKPTVCTDVKFSDGSDFNIRIRTEFRFSAHPYLRSLRRRYRGDRTAGLRYQKRSSAVSDRQTRASSNWNGSTTFTMIPTPSNARSMSLTITLHAPLARPTTAQTCIIHTLHANLPPQVRHYVNNLRNFSRVCYFPCYILLLLANKFDLNQFNTDMFITFPYRGRTLDRVHNSRRSLDRLKYAFPRCDPVTLTF